MRVLVTGGSGFLGSHILRFFGADDFSRRSGHDVLNLQDAQIAANYDVVIHLAAFLDKSPENSEESFLVNVEGTINILRSMRPNSVFIFASTKDVYGKHSENFEETPERCLTDYVNQSPLEWSKLIAEKYVEYYANQIGFRSCIFRLSNIYAPLSGGNQPSLLTHFLESIVMDQPILLPGNGKPVRDFLHVQDMARGCRAFIDSEKIHELYNLGGGYENKITLKELVGKIEKVANKKAVIDKTMKLPAPVPFNYVSDISKISHDLGWEPEISLDQGIDKIIKGE